MKRTSNLSPNTSAWSINVLASLSKRGVCAGVYTQTTDVEVEINGLRTYDRVNKVEPSWLKPLSELLLNTPDVVKATVLLPVGRIPISPMPPGRKAKAALAPARLLTRKSPPSGKPRIFGSAASSSSPAYPRGKSCYGCFMTTTRRSSSTA